jgi:putative Mg2+ transporter-C (MgtC) family protein
MQATMPPLTALFSIDWQEIESGFIHLFVAFFLNAIIGWNREREEHNIGIRAFPIVGMASCTYMMIGSGAPQVLQGLITGIGFVGGGAILKDGVTIKGTATAASVWSAGAIGAAVAMNRFGLAIILTALNLLALRTLLPLKSKLDAVKEDKST